MFERSLLESEGVDMEMVWMVIDCYKQAAIQTRERNIENEAIALSR